MGKFLLCSSASDFEKISNEISGFTQNSHLQGIYGQIATYQKLRIPTQNISRCGENFATGVGTFIYKGTRDDVALQMILQDWSGNLSIRDSILGSYCICIYKDGVMTVFVDDNATYRLYYYIDKLSGRLAVTTTSYHLAKGLGFPASELGFLENFFMRSVGSASMYPNIHQLMGNEIIQYSDACWSVERIATTEPVVSQDMISYIKEKYRELPRVFPTSGIWMTGGQDSRISLALMLAVGMKPTCYYGRGNSSTTCTKEADFQAVKLLSEQQHLPMSIMNWADSDKDNKNCYLQKYGELFLLYGMNKNIFQEFEHTMTSELLIFGYLGECFRTVETIMYYDKSDFSLAEYIDDMYLKREKSLMKPEVFSRFRMDIYRQYEDLCLQHGIDINHLTKDDFQKLNSFYRLRWDMFMNNFANQFMYSFPLFGEKNILSYAENASYDEKYLSKFQMRCIEQLSPDLLKIPFFSHIKPKVYHADTHELTEEDTSVRIKEVLQQHLTNPTMYRFCRYIYYVLRRDKKGLLEVQQEYRGREARLQQVTQKKWSAALDIQALKTVNNTELFENFSLMAYLADSIE